MPRSRITSQNMSCSALARVTHSTSSNSSSSALDGVRRLCSRPGPVDHDLAQLADFGMHSKRHDDLLC